MSLAEDCDHIALLGVNAREVYHADVHADVAYDRHELAVDHDAVRAVAEVAVQSIGISDRYCADDAILGQFAVAAVADCLGSWHLAYLQDDGLERASLLKARVVHGAESVMTDAEAHHVELVLRESLYACRVEYVAQHLVVERLVELVGHALEAAHLLLGEVVETLLVAAHEMREHRTHQKRVLRLQSLYQFISLIQLESETAHACVYLYVYRIFLYALALSLINKRFKHREAVNLRLQVVVYNLAESAYLRIHDDDRHAYALVAESRALVSHSHSQIVASVLLQGS